MTNLDIYNSIVETWYLEAKQEDKKLFYFVDEVKSLESGKKSYVIGRKGMGKTAISEYLYNSKNLSIYTERLSFKNFPFNMLYSLENNMYTSPNQYITIWKYLIYNAIAKMMSQNDNIDNKLLAALRKIYQDQPIKALNKLVPKWTANGFGAEVLGCGGNIDGISKKTKELSWIEKADILEEIIEKYADNSYYYVLIDELDEDYRDFEDEKQRKNYVNLLTSLFKAVQDIKAYFKDSNLKIRPIIFLGSDIYSFIRDSDKNKWSDYKIDLTWNSDKLYKMICHRMSINSCGSINENDVWSKLFPQPYVVMGNQHSKKMRTFDYITRSTHLRPRDYIYYISECSKLAISKEANFITSSMVKEVDKEFSEYLKGELTDEIFGVIPDIQQVYDVISQIRKQTFNPKEFIAVYSDMSGKTEAEAKTILLCLFDHGIIGNAPSMVGQQIFKYQYPNALFNFRENIVVHRGLYKALQIF